MPCIYGVYTGKDRDAILPCARTILHATSMCGTILEQLYVPVLKNVNDIIVYGLFNAKRSPVELGAEGSYRIYSNSIRVTVSSSYLYLRQLFVLRRPICNPRIGGLETSASLTMCQRRKLGFQLYISNHFVINLVRLT